MKRWVRSWRGRLCVEWTNHEDSVKARIEEEKQPAREYAFRYLEIEPGLYSILLGDRSLECRLQATESGWSVQIAGRTFSYAIEDPRRYIGKKAGIGVQGRQSIIAPMPGRVVRVLVEEGMEVQQGQGLVVVEAMKMQNEMKSPKSGRVVALAARAGASVAAGQVLVTVE